MENKESVAYKLLCTSCLCTGRTLLPVADQRMRQYYIDTLKEVPLCNMPQVCLNICWECKALLKKAVAFREQVKDSYRILQTYTSETLNECLLTDITRTPRLKIHHTNPIIIPVDDEPASSSVTDDRADDEIDNKHRDLQKVFVKEELKVEIDNGAASDDDVPSAGSDITDIEAEIQTLVGKKEKKKLKKACTDKVRQAKKIVKKLKTDNKQTKRTTVGNNIITIELSYEDMLLERERESKRDSYVNAEYKCESCLIGFHYAKSYKTHLETKHNPAVGDYSCPLCHCIMPSLESFTTHYKRHMKRYECGICHKRTTDLKVMQQHYFSRHDVALQKYTCNVCGKVSDSIDRHRYHKDTHKARVQCGECDKTFSHRAGLMNHRLAVHELNNEFPCTVCEKVFRWKTSLKRHLDKHDAKDKFSTEAAFCEPCDIGFSSVASYQRHLRNSLKHVAPHQLRFICDHCNRRFADKTKLRDHIEEKHLHRTYQCPICMKPSKNRVGLDQHIRNVHKGRPNNKMCHHCGKGFPTKVQLESHIRTHTGERPFICEFCPTTFSQQSNLYKHNRQVHLNIKSKRYPPVKKRLPSPSPSPAACPPAPAPAPAPATQHNNAVTRHHVQYSNGFGMTLQ